MSNNNNKALALDDEQLREQNKKLILDTVKEAKGLMSGGKKLTWLGAVYLIVAILFLLGALFIYIYVFFYLGGIEGLLAHMGIDNSRNIILCSVDNLTMKFEHPSLALDFKELFVESNCTLSPIVGANKK